MTAKYVQPGETITFTVTSNMGAVVNGQGVFLENGVFVVCAYSAAVGAQCEGHREGVYNFGKATTHAFSPGDPVYFDPSQDKVTGESLGPQIGVAVSSQLAADTAMAVLLLEAPRGAVQTAIERWDVTEESAFSTSLPVGTYAFGSALPKGARILKAWYRVLTTFTDGATDAATIALGVETDDTSGIKTAVAISDASNPWDAGYHDSAADGAMANVVAVTTAARQFLATVAVAALTAGVLELHYEWVRE